jgi:hypothetical protein
MQYAIKSLTILGFLLIISMIQSQAEAQYGGQGSPGASNLEEQLEKAREKIRQEFIYKHCLRPIQFGSDYINTTIRKI